MAPEIVKEEHYNCKIDLYRLGTLYYFIFYEYLYNRKNEVQLTKEIMSKTNKKNRFGEFRWSFVKLLKEFSDEIISFEDYFNHKFFKEKDNVLQNFKIKNEDNKN